MELYESGQLEKSDILDKIINEQEILNIFFRRSISNATRANTAMKLLNAEIQRDPSIRSTALALSTYLTQKWALEHNITTGLSDKECPEGITEMIDLNRILSEILDEKDVLMNLKYRRLQFANTRKITDLVEKAVNHLQYIPENGYRYHHIISGLHIYPGKYGENGPSFYEVKTHYIAAVKMLSIQYGERFDYLFSRILYSRRSLDEEAEELFHNTEALMKCYCTILWRYGEDGTLFKAIRNCRTTEELLEFGHRFADLDCERSILEYMILIRNAIEQVKYFPKNGELYYELLNIQTELILNQITLDTVLKKRLHLSRASYFKQRRKAYDVLSIVLWGYSTRTMISYLTTKD